MAHQSAFVVGYTMFQTYQCCCHRNRIVESSLWNEDIYDLRNPGLQQYSKKELSMVRKSTIATNFLKIITSAIRTLKSVKRNTWASHSPELQ